MKLLDLFKMNIEDIEKGGYVYNIPTDYKVDKMYRNKYLNYLLETIETYQAEKLYVVTITNENNPENPFIIYNLYKNGEFVNGIGALKSKLISVTNTVILPTLNKLFERVVYEDFERHWEEVSPPNLIMYEFIKTYHPNKFKGVGLNYEYEYPLGSVLDLYMLNDKPLVNETVALKLKDAEERGYKIILNLYSKYRLCNNIGSLVIYDNENEKEVEVFQVDSHTVELIIKSFAIITWLNMMDIVYEGKLKSIWND